jgi:hypothetical protein
MTSSPIPGQTQGNAVGDLPSPPTEDFEAAMEKMRILAGQISALEAEI